MTNVYRTAAMLLGAALWALAAEQGVMFRDDFNGQLQPGWQWIDPMGDCDHSLDAHPGWLRISIPESSRHDLYSGSHNFDAPRLVREVNGDFVIETKLSTSAARGEGGLLVWKDYRNNVRFERGVHFPNELFFAAHVNGAYMHRARDYVKGDPIWLRLERSGSTFRAFYSLDGAEWHLMARTYSIASTPPERMVTTDEGMESLKETDLTFQPVTGSVEMTVPGPLQVGLSVITKGPARSIDYDYFEIRRK